MTRRGASRPHTRNAADVQQAQAFHAFLAERRAELCDRLDKHAESLASLATERSYGAQLKRRRIKEIGAEIREIDRMLHGLRGGMGLRHTGEAAD
jgi:uncharacterized coiled-coil DUF342 family protein